jgi:hypothetical protein
MTARILPALVVVTLCCGSSLHAQPAKVAGTLTVNATRIPLEHIMAVSYETPSQGRVISVLVSDKAVNPTTFQTYTRIGPGEKYVPGIVTGAWVTMHNDKELSGFSFTIKADRTMILNDVLVGGDDNRFGLLDEYLVLELTSSASRVSGRLRTKEAIVAATQKVGLDVTFDAAVLSLGK